MSVKPPKVPTKPVARSTAPPASKPTAKGAARPTKPAKSAPEDEPRLIHGGPVASARAHLAATILNATATGIGCAFAIRHGVQARWQWTDEDVLDANAPDLRVAAGVMQVLEANGQAADQGARIETRCLIGPSRGFKTSSSAAAALLRAAHKAAGRSVGDTDITLQAVEACKRAGVTLTGAYDDQVAVTLGGCHVTDNAANRILASLPIPTRDVALWVPDHSIEKSRFAELDLRPLQAPAQRIARDLLRTRNVADAMTRNGTLFGTFYAEVGLPVNVQPIAVALDAGAVGAGLSGTGPGVAAFFRSIRPLPEVPGGRWVWSTTAA